jgi:hypothetical protein
MLRGNKKKLEPYPLFTLVRKGFVGMTLRKPLENTVTMKNIGGVMSQKPQRRKNSTDDKKMYNEVIFIRRGNSQHGVKIQDEKKARDVEEEKPRIKKQIKA